MKTVKLNEESMYTDIKKVLDLIEGHGFIAGGAARWEVDPLNRTSAPSDIDVYAYSKEDGQAIKRIFDANMILLYDHHPLYKYAGSYSKPIQLVFPIEFGEHFEYQTFGTPERVISDFDFTCNMFAIEKFNGDVIGTYTQQGLAHHRNMDAVINRITNPLVMIRRMTKYSNKGYSISSEDMLAVLQDWEKRSDRYKDEIDINVHAPHNLDTDSYPYLQFI